MNKVVTGDIIELGLNGQLDVILQGCNCQNNMGKGLGLTIKNTFPEVYEEDCKTVKGDRLKLGTITYKTVKNNLGGDLTIVNCYTQYKYWVPKKTVLTELWTIKPCMELVKLMWTGKKIGYPKIGCGLGGGNWDEVYPIILETLKGEDQTLVLYNN